MTGGQPRSCTIPQTVKGKDCRSLPECRPALQGTPATAQYTSEIAAAHRQSLRIKRCGKTRTSVHPDKLLAAKHACRSLHRRRIVLSQTWMPRSKPQIAQGRPFHANKSYVSLGYSCRIARTSWSSDYASIAQRSSHFLVRPLR